MSTAVDIAAARAYFSLSSRLVIMKRLLSNYSIVVVTLRRNYEGEPIDDTEYRVLFAQIDAPDSIIIRDPVVQQDFLRYRTGASLIECPDEAVCISNYINHLRNGDPRLVWIDIPFPPETLSLQEEQALATLTVTDQIQLVGLELANVALFFTWSANVPKQTTPIEQCISPIDTAINVLVQNCNLVSRLEEDFPFIEDYIPAELAQWFAIKPTIASLLEIVTAWEPNLLSAAKDAIGNYFNAAMQNKYLVSVRLSNIPWLL